MVRWRYGAGILAMVMLLGLSACSSSTEESYEDTRVEVEDINYSQMPGGVRILSGTLVNRSDATIRNAQVQVSLFDTNNRRVGQMIVTVQDIGPREEKRFREPVDSESEVTGARVRSVLIL